MAFKFLCYEHGSFDPQREWGCPGCVRDMRRDLTAAESEIARLRAALLEVTQVGGGGWHVSARRMRDIAIAALKRGEGE